MVDLFRQNKIGSRLVKHVFALYVLITFIVTSFQVYEEYSRSKEHIAHELRDVSQTLNPSLSISLWQMNRLLIESIFNSLKNVAIVTNLEILDDDRAMLFTSKMSSASHKDTINVEIPIVYNNPKDNSFTTVGYLNLYSDNLVALKRVKDSAFIIIINGLLKSLALWCIILFATRKIITVPLTRLTSIAQNFNPAHPNRSSVDPVLKRDLTSANDEIGILSRSFFAMSEALMEKVKSQNTKVHSQNQHIKTIEQERDNQFKEYQTVLENSLDCIFIRADDGSYTYASPSLEKVIGLSPEKLKNNKRMILELIVKDDRPNYESYLKNDHSIASEVSCIYRIKIGSHETRWIEERSKPFIDQEKGILGRQGVLRDITKQRNTEEQLLQAQKMDSIGQLAGGIAHDFNNMLCIINASTQVLESMPDNTPKHSKFLSMINEASARSAQLTHNLLAFARKNQFFTEEFDLTQLIKNTERLLSRSLGSDYRIVSELADETLLFSGERSQIEQILINLITNARDALPKGGKIYLTSGKETIHAQDFQEKGFPAPGEFAYFEVRDEGEGIPPHIQRKIFDPFFTTKEVGKGAGLGLSMVHGSVKYHNGHLTLKSTEGVGSSIKIYLPLSVLKPKSPLSAAISSTMKTIPRQGKILLVDDEENLRDVMRDVLISRGYEVETAVSGADALSRYQDRISEFDLLILDIVMPERNGVDTYKEFLKTKPDAKALFMSGYDRAALSKYGDIGPNATLLLKPFNPNHLCEKVEELILSTP